MPPRFGGIKLDFNVHSSPIASGSAVPLPIASSLNEFQATSQLHHGSYTSDLAGGKFKLSWASFEDMQIWLKKEQEAKFIELRLKKTRPHHGNKWTAQYIYVCARQGSGGASRYIKKHDWARKIPVKRLASCPCRLIIKTYPNTASTLGHYEDSHSHPVGHDNARYRWPVGSGQHQPFRDHKITAGSWHSKSV